MPDPEAFGRAPILAKDTDDADPIAQLVVALADLVWLLSRVDRTGFGPDSVRGRILDQLFRHEPLRQAVIGVRAGASASVTSRIIHRLERDGLVVRRPGTTDRRHTKVSLTERGNRLVRDSRRIRIERLGRLALHISPARRNSSSHACGSSTSS